jgi:hypothetical protein
MTQRGIAATKVAQNCILPYRGFSIRWRVARSLAECNSAIQQIQNLRYKDLRSLRKLLCIVVQRHRSGAEESGNWGSQHRRLVRLQA